MAKKPKAAKRAADSKIQFLDPALQSRPSDEVVRYDTKWLGEENERRRAEGLPPLRQRKRNAIEREQLRALRQIASPMMARDINPDFRLVPDHPETRQPSRERARRALAALFPDGVPDAAATPPKRLEAQVNAWLKANGLDPVGQRTIGRAAGRK